MLKINQCWCGCSLQTGATIIVVFDVIWNIIFGLYLSYSTKDDGFFDILSISLIGIELCIAPIAFVGIRTEISLAILPFLIFESCRLVCLGLVIVFYPVLNITAPVIFFVGFFVIDFGLFVVMCHCFAEIRQKNYYREKVAIVEAVQLGKRKISQVGSAFNRDASSSATYYENFV